MIVYKCNDSKYRTVEQLNKTEFKYYLSDEQGNATGKRSNLAEYDNIPKTLREATEVLNTEVLNTEVLNTEEQAEQEEEQAGRTLAYLRISTLKDEQTFSRQEGLLESYKIDQFYKERLSGAKSKQTRPALYALLNDLRKNDTVIITEISRLSRSTVDLLSIVEEITEKGANIISLKDSWLNTKGPTAKFMLTMVGALAELEREQIVERVNEGLAVAKAKGTKLGRPEVNKKKLELAFKMYDSGEDSIADIVEITGISKPTLYRRLKERDNDSISN